MAARSQTLSCRSTRPSEVPGDGLAVAAAGRPPDPDDLDPVGEHGGHRPGGAFPRLQPEHTVGEAGLVAGQLGKAPLVALSVRADEYRVVVGVVIGAPAYAAHGEYRGHKVLARSRV